MKNLKLMMSILVMLMIASFAYAKRDVENKSVGGENSWQESFDINKKKDGKYNIIVTAEDKAGNLTHAGPYNIYIDDESDLPITGITNPVENMRVPGNLNIVGTCIDDDKVETVYLVFDGDEDNPVKAEGTEYWSYYLDTTNLVEGPHTIEVYGVDNGNPDAYRDENGNIDESKVKPKIGHRAKVVWQLDRRSPIIEINSDNHYMGELVSGKITLEGTVTDGNGIANLEYSLDGGKYYDTAKIKEIKRKTVDENGLRSIYTFSINVDTTKFEDGAATCWFKATDKAGSIGRYAFLFFVDNTKPDVKIVTPKANEKCKGIFTIAGYANDKNGITDLKWVWGEETGDFELTPGNPYWVKEINSIGKNEKEVFAIIATDTMGNTVEVKREISLDQESDKPLVEIKYPAHGVDIESEANQLFIRGIAKDDDGIASIKWKIDNGEEKTIENVDGVFYADINEELSSGKHVLSVYAIDNNGVKGNVSKSEFSTKGTRPSIGKAVIKNSKETKDFVDGISVNPESDSTYETEVKSTCGLSKVKYIITWGQDKVIEKELPLNVGAKNLSVKIPLHGEAFPWGVLNLTVAATDIYGRTTEINSLLKISDLTKIIYKEPGVYFDDNNLDNRGGVFVGSENPLTGFFVGGKIEKISISPNVKSVTLERKQNSFILSSDVETEKFVVKVETSFGAVYESQEIYFKTKGVDPVINITSRDFDSSKGIPFEFETSSSVLKIDGKVEADSEYDVKYRILAAKAELKNEIVVSSKIEESSDFKDVKVRRGSFSITDLGYDDFVDGVSVVEILVETKKGQRASEAVFVRKIPLAPVREVLDESGKAIEKDEPKLYWLKGFDYYGVCIYQGTVDNTFKYLRAKDLKADGPGETFTVTTAAENGKKSATYTSPVLDAKSESDVIVKITKVGEEDYLSGMQVVLPRGANKETAKKVKVEIKANNGIKTVNYRILGYEGNVVQTGTAALKTIKESEEYEAEVPLANLAAGVTKIILSVKDSRDLNTVYQGTVSIIREHAEVDSEEKIYWAKVGEVDYDAEQNYYVLNDGEKMYAYANVQGPFKISIRGSESGLKTESENQVIRIIANKDGLYKNVVLRVEGKNGSSYTTEPISLMVDTSEPTISIKNLDNMAYIQDKLIISGNATDGNGIKELEYCIEDKKPSVVDKQGNVSAEELVWNKLSINKNGTFNTSIDLTDVADGYVALSIRAKDNVGKIAQENYVFCKDTTPPEVSVIVPVAELVKNEVNIINGENTIVFSVKDNGRMKNIVYESSDGKKSTEWEIFKQRSKVPVKVELNEEGVEVPVKDTKDPLRTMNSSMPNMRIGVENFPIDNNMKYSFADMAGNVTTINKWDFAVDEESDKPVTEIHLPTDNQVITTDFTISGIINDDDGNCKIFYKIDNGKYEAYDNGGEYANYKIEKQIKEMTDNEHIVTVYAVDKNGVKGDEVSSRFRISLEEPKGGVTSPAIDKTVKGVVELRGWASDKNNISRVQVSLDNGATYNDAEGTTDWRYVFDTRVIQDGTHVVFVKIWDGYDITGLYSSLINIDNTAPDLKLELPLDDSKTTKNIFFSGQTTDNIGLTSLYLRIRSLEGKSISAKLAHRDLEPSEIISQVLDISELNSGFYNIELTGTDAAGNITRVSRNIELDKSKSLSKVSLLYPLNGEHLQGEFNIYGQAISEKEDPVAKVELYIDDVLIESLTTETLSESNYFKFRIKEEMIKNLESQEKFILEAGKHKYVARIITESGKEIRSIEQNFVYSPYGPWVTLDNFTYGDFARNRPLLKGKAGYTLTSEEKELLKKKETPSEIKSAIEAKKIKQVYLSFNNGKTYEPVSKENKGSWQYRVENLDIPDGIYFLLIKAEMYNGENAVTRTIVQIDRTLPEIKLISPGEGGRYNQVLNFEGLSSDDIGLKNVKMTLRKGDKASYEVPKFIQGLYFDSSIWGATLYNVGIGLTAFDNAVKIQANFGQFTQEQRYWICDLFGQERSDYRFGGTVIGAKIIAQVGYIPFRYFFGRDWDWLSASLSVGANFSYFSDSGASTLTGEKVPQVLSAALVQVEFPRFTIPNSKVFNTWSIYTEPQVWFIPSDIASDDAKKYVFTCSFGLRTSVF